jgi:hypothetical protein
MSPGRTKQQVQTDEAAYLDKRKRGPQGFLIYSPGGEELHFGKLPVNQSLFGLAASYVLVWMLAVTAGATG